MTVTTHWLNVFWNCLIYLKVGLDRSKYDRNKRSISINMDGNSVSTMVELQSRHQSSSYLKVGDKVGLR
eukprot:scaffold472_cov215-Alexandrium_tamarense.AAC.2